MEGHVERDDPDELLDPYADPAGVAFAPLGNEAGSDLNWIALLRSRVENRTTASPRLRWWVLASLLAGLLALNFTFTVFVVALPSVARQLRTSVGVLTWTMVGPLLAYGLAAPLLGKLGDVVGHRRLYLWGLATALVTAALTVVAPNAGLLLAARTLDGVQGAATGTASSALINMLFAPEERVTAMGWWSLIGAGGPVIGVSLGAPIIAVLGWRALFVVQFGLILVALAVVAILLPRGTGRPALAGRVRDGLRGVDWIGSSALSLAVTALMLGLSLGPVIGWVTPGTIGCGVGALASGALFVRRLRRARHPLIPPHYFRRRNFVMPMVLRACANFAYFGGFFLFPLVMEQGYGYSVSRVGALSIARPLTFALVSPIAGYVAARVGERRSAIAGAAALVGSLALFAALRPSTGAAVVALALGLSGFGMGVAMPATSAVMANEVAEHEFGVMSAAQMLAMQVGEVAGIQVLETVRQGLERARHLGPHSPAADLLGTFRIPFVVGGLVALVGFGASLYVTSVPRTSGAIRRAR